MNSNQDFSTTTAILLFAQSERTESVTKPIAYNLEKNVLLWKKLNDRIVKTIQKTNLPYFISNENNQIGSSFGEKITLAVETIFAKGFEKVIVVGNDCIALQAHHLLNAFQKMQTNNCVIGADYNGGAYLIGITKSEFNGNQFAIIPWQTKKVFAALQALNKAQSVVYLPQLNDCNSTTDFKKAIHQLPFFDIAKKILLSFLYVPIIENKFRTNRIFNQYYTTSFNKGSPFI